jgi:hypothetical protein
MSELKRSVFRLCDGKFYEGVHNTERRWNGWAMPWFTEAVMLQIAKDAGLTVRFVDLNSGVEYSSVFTDYNEDEEQLIIKDGLYSFDGWCWDTYTDTEIADMISEELAEYKSDLMYATDAYVRKHGLDRSKVTVKIVASYS